MTDYHSELLILADGRVLVRNLTPGMAALLLAACPENAELQRRRLARRPARPAAKSIPRKP